MLRDIHSDLARQAQSNPLNLLCLLLFLQESKERGSVLNTLNLTLYLVVIAACTDSNLYFSCEEIPVFPCSSDREDFHRGMFQVSSGHSQLSSPRGHQPRNLLLSNFIPLT